MSPRGGRGHQGSTPQQDPISRAMSQIPYYDSSDNRLLNMLTEARANQYLAEGRAHAIRSKNGRIVRLYSIARERVHITASSAVIAMRAAASQTTQRIQGEHRKLIAPPNIREHRRNPAPTPRLNVPLDTLVRVALSKSKGQ